jgi:hypothetical protein
MEIPFPGGAGQPSDHRFSGGIIRMIGIGNCAGENAYSTRRLA